ncbi:SGNH/GDSL hydrolase family protein [Williamsia soli]|uniref:SGNH/GDSL hydrolase family protein n=1 Tax=Williamsia soli TaxID=364929 RepID=UPI001A9E3799|nr:SGNH/GDSL hydrolase family protein [Williamsia soli]
MSGSKRRLARDLVATAAATAGTAGAGWGAWTFLNGQARTARTVIPHRTDNAPNGDGIYGPDGLGPLRVRRGEDFDLHVMVFGDSTAAGLGAEIADETPGVQLTRKLTDETGKRIRLSTKAIVGATSRSLTGQVDAMLIAGPPPDIAIIFIGANDVTSTSGVRASAKRLGAAVRRLREAGALVVVGTCPDLGVIAAIPQPLRTVIRQYGLRLAAAQAIETRAAGGTPVPLADLLAREFLAAPDRMLSADRYHPSAAGYELAAQILLPAVLAGLGEWGSGPLPEPPEVSAIAEDNKWSARTRAYLNRAARRR